MSNGGMEEERRRARQNAAERRAAAERGASPTAEADALFNYFARRFGLRTGRAEEVAAHLEEVADAIDRLRTRADAAETRAKALDDALRRSSGAPAADRREGPIAPDARSAATRFALDGVRAARVAVRALERDRDFVALDEAIDLDETLRGAQARFADAAEIEPAALRDAAREAWSHALWRADALLEAYYPSRPPWRDLRDGVADAAQALRRLLRLEGLKIGRVALLRPLDPAAERWEEPWSDHPGPLADLDIVRAGVAAAAGGAARRFAVDVESLGYEEAARGRVARARLIMFAPAAWV